MSKMLSHEQIQKSSEEDIGVIKIATEAESDDITNDSEAITPKKLNYVINKKLVSNIENGLMLSSDKNKLDKIIVTEDDENIILEPDGLNVTNNINIGNDAIIGNKVKIGEVELVYNSETQSLDFTYVGS